ncbi:MAG: winged helix-turn-helix domain-containing protein [Ktedonobacteraceae bacterium]|nr:winged helix-turn-helix domain-containing protein [Ktedonobacteraceae bacterium]
MKMLWKAQPTTPSAASRLLAPERELHARIRALLRRARKQETWEASTAPVVLTILADQLCLDIEQHRWWLTGQPIHLTPKEFALLRVLMQHPRKSPTHRFLLQEVWGQIYGVEQEYVHVALAHLRGKLEAHPAHPRYLWTDTGVGYCFADPTFPNKPTDEGDLGGADDHR